jgi:HEPN domain-containing protein
MNDKVNYWFDISEYDLETAKAMLISKRFLYVGFMCHLAIEKLLKAYYVSVKDEMPPYSHNLTYLAEKSSLLSKLSEDQKSFIDELEPMNIEARYP